MSLKAQFQRVHVGVSRIISNIAIYFFAISTDFLQCHVADGITCYRIGLHSILQYYCNFMSTHTNQVEEWSKGAAAERPLPESKERS